MKKITIQRLPSGFWSVWFDGTWTNAALATKQDAIKDARDLYDRLKHDPAVILDDGFIACAHFDAATYDEPGTMTTEEAAYTLSTWKQEGQGIPGYIDPELFARTWNAYSEPLTTHDTIKSEVIA